MRREYCYDFYYLSKSLNAKKPQTGRRSCYAAKSIVAIFNEEPSRVCFVHRAQDQSGFGESAFMCLHQIDVGMGDSLKKKDAQR